MKTVLEIERPIVELEKKIGELRALAKSEDVNISKEIHVLEEKLKDMKRRIYSNLTPWQRVLFARHPNRPYTLDYVRRLFSDFTPLHGDRMFADDRAIISGVGYFEDRSLVVIGHQKGRNLEENIMRNFGCAHPEGYRKAIRIMRLAERMGLPIVVFIDTPGAYPGIGAEERGQAHAIAENLRDMFEIKVPILVYVIGEGGSGGALGIGVGDRICVLENAYYSVISPEGCASILWKTSESMAEIAPKAAEVLKLTAKDLFKLGIIDEIVPEPLGGAHNDWDVMAGILKNSIKENLSRFEDISIDKLLADRYNKFRSMGRIAEG